MSSARTRTRQMVLTALAAALAAVISPWSIAIGPISLTLGVFAAFFAGALLTPGWAFAAQLVYLALGCMGLPVFSGFVSGPQALLGPTGGYLAAFPLMALILSLFCRLSPRLPVRLAGVVLALAVCYVLGTAWFIHLSGNDLKTSLAWCVIPFIIPDFCKGLAALALVHQLERRM